MVVEKSGIRVEVLPRPDPSRSTQRSQSSTAQQSVVPNAGNGVLLEVHPLPTAAVAQTGLSTGNAAQPPHVDSKPTWNKYIPFPEALKPANIASIGYTLLAKFSGTSSANNAAPANSTSTSAAPKPEASVVNPALARVQPQPQPTQSVPTHALVVAGAGKGALIGVRPITTEIAPTSGVATPPKPHMEPPPSWDVSYGALSQVFTVRNVARAGYELASHVYQKSGLSSAVDAVTTAATMAAQPFVESKLQAQTLEKRHQGLQKRLANSIQDRDFHEDWLQLGIGYLEGKRGYTKDAAAAQLIFEAIVNTASETQDLQKWSGPQLCARALLAETKGGIQPEEAQQLRSAYFQKKHLESGYQLIRILANEPARGKMLYDDLFRQEHPQALYDVAMDMHLPEEKLLLLEKAMKKGHVPAHYEMAMLEENNPQKKKDLLKYAAQHDYPPAQRELAKLYWKIDPNHPKGNLWNERAYINGDLEATQTREERIASRGLTEHVLAEEFKNDQVYDVINYGWKSALSVERAFASAYVSQPFADAKDEFKKAEAEVQKTGIIASFKQKLTAIGAFFSGIRRAIARLWSREGAPDAKLTAQSQGSYAGRLAGKAWKSPRVQQEIKKVGQEGKAVLSRTIPVIGKRVVTNAAEHSWIIAKQKAQQSSWRDWIPWGRK